MEAMGVHSLGASAMKLRTKVQFSTRVTAAKKGTTVFPIGESGPRELNTTKSSIKLLTNVEKLRLLSKAEKAGLLSTAENLGFSLSAVEKLGLLSKAEELGVLSAATDPETAQKLLNLSWVLLGLPPIFVYFVPETHNWEVLLQGLVILVGLVGGSTAFAAYSLVSKLQKSG